MRAEVAPDSGDELRISLDIEDLPNGVRLSSKNLRRTLPAAAPGLADAFLAMVGAPQERGEPRVIRAVTIRVVRTVVIGEVTIPLPDGTQVFA